MKSVYKSTIVVAATAIFYFLFVIDILNIYGYLPLRWVVGGIILALVVALAFAFALFSDQWESDVE